MADKDERDGGTVDVEVRTNDGRVVIYEVKRRARPQSSAMALTSRAPHPAQ